MSTAVVCTIIQLSKYWMNVGIIDNIILTEQCCLNFMELEELEWQSVPKLGFKLE